MGRERMREGECETTKEGCERVSARRREGEDERGRVRAFHKGCERARIRGLDATFSHTISQGEKRVRRSDRVRRQGEKTRSDRVRRGCDLFTHDQSG